MDYQLLHLIHDVMAKVIDRVNGNGDEEVEKFPSLKQYMKLNLTRWLDDRYTGNDLWVGAEFGFAITAT